ncbi:hypothetical protein PMAYCL1PPCAC_02957 [Pristionchus mayeri]|uniref:SH2 domain-containing protein n=1 Tax=Pristionchus mayeri TaxID=1317129 RepID=A0AAN5C7G5_9BILA|nr:hypothetical protein PMAYCL1PPCAC_02957 [Pristionchus mayeri]
MASSSRRTRQDHRNRHQSRSASRSSSASDSSTPTYVVEEDSHGNLVNKRLGVQWPTRVHSVPKRYPFYSSTSQSSMNIRNQEDQFASSPYEMISIAELDAVTGSRSSRGHEKRAQSAQKSRSRHDSSSSASSSPQYVTLSSRSEEEDSRFESDESTAKIDSVVFDTAEELHRYQRLFRHATPAQSATTISSAVNTVTRAEREETDRHYIGVRSRRSVDKKLTPGQFFMYYDKPSGAEIPVSIELKIGYMSSTNKIYHFPIQRFECQGEPYYAVMQTDTDVKMFPSIASLVQHYHTFSHVDPETGRLETFGVPV